jgi:hypothetical protein
MSGGIDFFASSLADASDEAAQTAVLSAVARVCEPRVRFVDRRGGRLVRAYAGDAPRIEDLSGAEGSNLKAALAREGIQPDGSLEQVPTSWIVSMNEIGHVFVPGPVRMTAAGYYPALGAYAHECVVAPLADLARELDEYLEGVGEIPDPDLEQIEFLRRVRNYLRVASNLELVLVVRSF